MDFEKQANVSHYAFISFYKCHKTSSKWESLSVFTIIFNHISFSLEVPGSSLPEGEHLDSHNTIVKLLDFHSVNRQSNTL